MTTRIEAVDYQAPDAQARFVQSLKDTGFGVLKNHPISKDLVSSIYSNWKQFFDGSEKEQFQFNVDTQDGFFP